MRACMLAKKSQNGNHGAGPVVLLLSLPHLSITHYCNHRLPLLCVVGTSPMWLVLMRLAVIFMSMVSICWIDPHTHRCAIAAVITVVAAGLTVSVPACCCISLDPGMVLHPLLVMGCQSCLCCCCCWFSWNVYFYFLLLLETNHLLTPFSQCFQHSLMPSFILSLQRFGCGLLSISFLHRKGPVVNYITHACSQTHTNTPSWKDFWLKGVCCSNCSHAPCHCINRCHRGDNHCWSGGFCSHGWNNNHHCAAACMLPPLCARTRIARSSPNGNPHSLSPQLL